MKSLKKKACIDKFMTEYDIILFISCEKGTMSRNV